MRPTSCWHTKPVALDADLSRTPELPDRHSPSANRIRHYAPGRAEDVVTDEDQTFRLGTNARGAAVAGGLLLVLSLMMALVALDLAFGSRSKVHGAADAASIAISISGAVVLGYLGVKMTQIRCVASRNGLVIYNLFGPVRTMAGRFARYRVPAVVLNSGAEVKIRALALGRSTDPPIPQQLAVLDEIRSIIGLPIAESPSTNSPGDA
jgi:hypothetical protein